MNSLLQRAKAFNTKKSLGQNFLVSEEYLQKIVEAIDAKSSDNILEIGPGIGFLTEQLALSGAQIMAIDLDERAIGHISCQDKVKILKADALHFDLNSPNKPYMVVGNLPFNVGTKILLRFIGELDEADWAIKGIDKMVLMFQKEVAERLCAKPSSKAYNPLSLLVQSKSQIEYLFTVPAKCFCPIPKVTAGVVLIKPLENNLLQNLSPIERQNFKKIIKTAFSTRRKNLKNALQSLFKPEQLRSLNISPELRPENLTLEDYLKLAQSLSAGL